MPLPVVLLVRVYVLCPNGLGKVAKVFFIGDEKVTDSFKYLTTAVNNYDMALSVFHTGALIKVYETLKGY
jgi:hypothetical protein